MRRVRIAVFAAILALPAIGQSQAQSLRVSPVTIEQPASERSVVFNVGNAGSKPLQIQARVFRWSQQGGRDVLEKTADVAVSPPVLSLNENGEGIVRLVRVANTPVTGEETYRILFDELPSREKLQGMGVKLLIRQSIPVFFYGLDRQPGSLTWQTRREGGKTVLEARNQGQKRIRLSKMTVTDAAARQLVSIEGLAGYVLGGQTFAWELPAGEAGRAPDGQALNIEAQTDDGPIKASAALGKSG
jgi:fimbrial chaperone protein